MDASCDTWDEQSINSPSHKKLKITPSGKKVKATIYWDHQCASNRFPDPWSDRGCNLLLCQAGSVENFAETTAMFLTSAILSHDNGRLNMALDTCALLQGFRWYVLEHPPYSTDFASSFSSLQAAKETLGRSAFTNQNRSSGCRH